MKLYLCANEYTEEQRNEAALVRDALSARGFVFTGDASECDLVISLGGDGAMLKAAKTALAADKPLMGINSGRLGYLCAMKVQDMDRCEEVLSKARISGRLVLETEEGGKKVYAVNDLIFGKQFFEAFSQSLFKSENIIRVKCYGISHTTAAGMTTAAIINTKLCHVSNII